MFNFGEDVVKKMYEEWEKSISTTLEKMVKDQTFVSELAKAMAATMSGKAAYSKFVDESMSMLNLPTKAEMIQVLQKLTDIEERIVELAEKIEDVSDDFAEKLEKLEKGKMKAKSAEKKDEKESDGSKGAGSEGQRAEGPKRPRSKKRGA
jgi:hypothetical protein